MKWLIQNQNSHSLENLELFSNHSEKFDHSPSRRVKMSLSSMCVPSIFLYALPTMPGHAPRCTQLIFRTGRAVHKSIMSELMTRSSHFRPSIVVFQKKPWAHYTRIWSYNESEDLILLLIGSLGTSG